MARKAKEQGGGRLTRSETVTIRLDPRLNYLCEIAARVQRRTKSSFIEAVIDEAIHNILLLPRDDPEGLTIGDQADDLWKIREHERLVGLVEIAPHLMTMREQEIWAVICEHGFFWRGKYMQDPDTLDEAWTWQCSPDKLISKNVADSWDKIVEIAEGKAESDILPKYAARRPIEIPF